jgi:hypothetical protein
MDGGLMLVDAEGLLAALFDEKSRPSLRWLEEQRKRRAIPYIKIGSLVRFDVDKVRSRIEQKYTVGRSC